jgi:hypothetical protein
MNKPVKSKKLTEFLTEKDLKPVQQQPLNGSDLKFIATLIAEKPEFIQLLTKLGLKVVSIKNIP